MFGLTALESKLAVTLFIVVGVLGYTLYERHEGAVQCVKTEAKAETTQESNDAHTAATAVNTFQQDLSDIPAAVSSASHMLVCSAPSRVSSRPTTASAQSSKPALIDGDSRMLPGTEAIATADIGPAVHDIALGCLQIAADAQQLWNLSVKEAAK